MSKDASLSQNPFISTLERTLRLLKAKQKGIVKKEEHKKIVSKKEEITQLM
jgi:hypothetical protein